MLDLKYWLSTFRKKILSKEQELEVHILKIVNGNLTIMLNIWRRRLLMAHSTGHPNVVINFYMMHLLPVSGLGLITVHAFQILSSKIYLWVSCVLHHVLHIMGFPCWFHNLRRSAFV